MFNFIFHFAESVMVSNVTTQALRTTLCVVRVDYVVSWLDLVVKYLDFLGIFFVVNGVAFGTAVHRSCPLLMDLIILCEMALSFPCDRRFLVFLQAFRYTNRTLL